MAIVPVAVTFAHYSDTAGQLLAVAQVVMDDDTSIAVSHPADHCQSAKSHPASCSFHVCVDCAITSSFGFFPVHSSDHYHDVVKPASVPLFVPPAIKPPITTL